MLKNLTDEENEGYKDMCSDTRRDFLKKAAGLCGPELKKLLTETIVWSITNERAHSVKYEGDFMPVGVAEEKMKNQPEQLAKLKSLAPQVKHHFTGEEMIWVPTLSMKDEQKTNTTQERKRTLSSEQKVKATTPAKVAKVDFGGETKNCRRREPNHGASSRSPDQKAKQSRRRYGNFFGAGSMSFLGPIRFGPNGTHESLSLT